MAYEIINSLHSKSLIRVVGNTSIKIELTDLEASEEETVNGVVITQVTSTSDGVWKIYRGDDSSGVLMLELPNYSNFILHEFGAALANNSDQNLYITNTGSSGSLILLVKKDSKYSTDLGIK